MSLYYFFKPVNKKLSDLNRERSVTDQFTGCYQRGQLKNLCLWKLGRGRSIRIVTYGWPR